MFDYSGQVVIVTGSSSGLGVQMAHGFAAQGANLVLTARRIGKLEEVAAEIRTKYGVECLPVECDVTDVAAVDAMVEKAVEKYGKIDVVVNNAGSNKGLDIFNTTDDDWDFTIKTDLTSLFYVSRAAAKVMKDAGYGRIINIASMYGLVGGAGEPGALSYHTSKGGVVNFTRELASELARHNITVNAICPGFFATELTIETLETEAFQQFTSFTVPLMRYGKEGELNAAAVFLGSKEASYVTGVALPVDGGYTCK